MGPEGGDYFDVIVVGGGINGSAIARDAAMRGFSVLLVEKDDISSATSAWSSRMIHGGLKYLENCEFGLVRESLREREWLLRAAPHLVSPLPFMMPFLRRNRRGDLLLRAGMLAYDVLSFDKSLPHHRLCSQGAALRAAPGLDRSQLQGAALFYDAQAAYAERLSVENVLSALEHGARVLTHTKVTRLLIEHRTVVGIEYSDLLSGAPSSARATVTVNATGPWADELLKDVPGHDQPLIGGSKGTHLVVDPFPGAPPTCALYAEAAQDGRPVVVIPWLGRYLVGSTDIRCGGDPGDAWADEGEVNYILSEANSLMPSAGLTRETIRFVYTGVRPLPYRPDDDVARITRHHIINDHAPALDGLVTIVGGKLTTFRSLAQDAVDRISRKITGSTRRCATRAEPLPGGRTADYAAFAARFKASIDLGDLIGDRLLSLYGVRAPEVIQLAQRERGLKSTIDEKGSVLAAEIVYGLRTESARTLTDVLMRRTMLGLDPDLSIDSVERAAAVMGEDEGWTEGRAAAEIDDYANYAKRFRLAAVAGLSVSAPSAVQTIG